MLQPYCPLLTIAVTRKSHSGSSLIFVFPSVIHTETLKNILKYKFVLQYGSRDIITKNYHTIHGRTHATSQTSMLRDYSQYLTQYFLLTQYNII